MGYTEGWAVRDPGTCVKPELRAKEEKRGRIEFTKDTSDDEDERKSAVARGQGRLRAGSQG